LELISEKIAVAMVNPPLHVMQPFYVQIKNCVILMTTVII